MSVTDLFSLWEKLCSRSGEDSAPVPGPCQPLPPTAFPTSDPRLTGAKQARGGACLVQGEQPAWCRGSSLPGAGAPHTSTSFCFFGLSPPSQSPTARRLLSQWQPLCVDTWVCGCDSRTHGRGCLELALVCLPCTVVSPVSGKHPCPSSAPHSQRGQLSPGPRPCQQGPP